MNYKTESARVLCNRTAGNNGARELLKTPRARALVSAGGVAVLRRLCAPELEGT